MNYEAIARKVAAKIEAKGKPAEILRSVDAPGWMKRFDPLTGKNYWEDGQGATRTDDPTVQRIPCHVLEDTPRQMFVMSLRQDSLVETTDRFFYCTERNVQTGDGFEVGGEVLKVAKVRKVRPAAVTLYTEVQAK